MVVLDEDELGDAPAPEEELDEADEFDEEDEESDDPDPLEPESAEELDEPLLVSAPDDPPRLSVR